jgi:hypothetical protein
MRKYRKFNEGGASDLEDFEDKAMPKRYSALEELASGREKGSFDEDVYARAKRFVDRGGDEAAPKAAAKPKPKVAAPTSSSSATSASSGRAEIPGAGSYKAPASTGEMMGETERNVLNTLGAVSGLTGTIPLVRTARAAMKPKPNTALATSETPVTFLGASGRRSMGSPERIGTTPKALSGPKAAEDTGTKAVELSKESVNRSAAKRAMEGQQRSKEEKELLESTLRGRAGRKDIQSRRPGPKKPEVSASDKADKAPRGRSSYRDDSDVEFRRGGSTKAYAKGGSVRGGGCESRGKTKGRFV